MNRAFQFLVVASLLWSVFSTISIYPHQLAYFNEVAGGPENGHKHLLGSNLDWGQDCFLLGGRDYSVVVVGFELNSPGSYVSGVANSVDGDLR